MTTYYKLQVALSVLDHCQREHNAYPNKNSKHAVKEARKQVAEIETELQDGRSIVVRTVNQDAYEESFSFTSLDDAMGFVRACILSGVLCTVSI